MESIKDFINKEIGVESKTEIIHKKNVLNKEERQQFDEIHEAKMYNTISDLLKEAMEALMKREYVTKPLMRGLNEELIRAVNIIFKEELRVVETCKDDKEFMRFYVDKVCVFEYGYSSL